MSDNADKKMRILIWILAGSCILNLIFAFNAGQKRKIAVSKYDDLDARLVEIELRYKNAVQSYDAIDKQLKEAKKDLQEQQLYGETLKDTLQKEQKKSQGLQEELDKLKTKTTPKAAARPAPKPIVKAVDKPKQKASKSNLDW